MSRPDAQSDFRGLPPVVLSCQETQVPTGHDVSHTPYRLPSILLINMKHKRAVSNYQLLLKLEKHFSPQGKFKHSRAQLNDGDTSENCIVMQCRYCGDITALTQTQTR